MLVEFLNGSRDPPSLSLNLGGSTAQVRRTVHLNGVWMLTIQLSIQVHSDLSSSARLSFKLKLR